jgi:hypothetical protein
LKWKSVAVAIDEEEHHDEVADLQVGCTFERYIPWDSC